MALVWFSIGKKTEGHTTKAALLSLGKAEELILSYHLHAEKCPDRGLRQNRIS